MLEAILLGIVQGLTEFLPVSSTAHLILVSWLMDGEAMPLALNVALQGGTMLATLAYFWRDWLHIARQALARVTRRERSFEADVLLPSLILGTIPIAVIGVLLEEHIERVFHQPEMTAWPLAIVGVLLWWIDRRSTGELNVAQMTYSKAFLIGMAQACALIPGVSRSGSTILAGRALGMDRGEAARFSFLLSMPALAGACLLEADEIANYLNDPTFYVGVFTSFAVGCLAIGGLLRFLKRFGFGGFAIYRVALAAAILVLV